MSYASQLLCHSRKLASAPHCLPHEHAVLVRCFSRDASIHGGDDLCKKQRHKVFKTPSASCGTSAFDPTVSSAKIFSGKFSRMGVSMNAVGGRSSTTSRDRYAFSSPTMTEGNIARWLKKDGDKISPGEVLCEVETDKATVEIECVEIECMEEGYLAKIVCGDGAKEIKVGEVIAITVEDEDDIANYKDCTPQKSEGASAPAAEQPSAPAPPKKEEIEESKSFSPTRALAPSVAPPTGDRVFASPHARKLAEENNVSISSIKGTGPDGRIVKTNVEEYLGKEATSTTPKTKDASAGPIAGINYTDIPVTQIRKVTASRLLLSKQTIPRYYLTVDARVDKLTNIRGKLNSLQEASGGKRISVNDVVIKNADKKGLSAISEEVKVLAQKARGNTLRPEDYEGGTFTVSNLGGPFGIKQFCSIINPPQAGILAIGSAEKRVVPGSGGNEFKFASFMSATLSCDYRVLDGAIGAEWLKAFKGYI